MSAVPHASPHQVLTTGHWPTYKLVELTLPAEVRLPGRSQMQRLCLLFAVAHTQTQVASVSAVRLTLQAPLEVRSGQHT